MEKQCKRVVLSGIEEILQSARCKSQLKSYCQQQPKQQKLCCQRSYTSSHPVSAAGSVSWPQSHLCVSTCAFFHNHVSEECTFFKNPQK